MSAVILRPNAVLDPVEAMRLRGNFDLVAGSFPATVILDLSGTTHLSGAGLAAVTNIVVRARRMGMAMRVLLPEQGSDAARIIDHADLWRFLRSAADSATSGGARARAGMTRTERGDHTIMDAHILTSFRRTRRVHRSAWGTKNPLYRPVPVPVTAPSPEPVGAA
jgi:hypothetical protein